MTTDAPFAMRELIELQTGQVAFISGLMSGFSISIAVQLLRYGIRNRRTQAVFLMFLLCSLLFLVALFVDVRLSIELAGYDTVSAQVLEQVSFVRNLGTGCATTALIMFILATGSLGWLASPVTGGITTVITIVICSVFWLVWSKINTISVLLSNV
ncbi:MAG: hypothetical protein AB8B64_26120 [Granulosicoccus sp.]